MQALTDAEAGLWQEASLCLVEAEKRRNRHLTWLGLTKAGISLRLLALAAQVGMTLLGVLKMRTWLISVSLQTTRATTLVLAFYPSSIKLSLQFTRVDVCVSASWRVTCSECMKYLLPTIPDQR